jgi:hypothetical protein
MEQQQILLRDFLMLCTGIEGNYIRVAAPANSTANIPPISTTNNTNNTATSSYRREREALHASYHISNWPKLSEIHLMIDPESIDRSIYGQVSELLIFGENIMKIRDFIHQQSRYEYGIISHALTSSMKEIMNELDVFFCQLEYLLNTERLTIQKTLFLLFQSNYQLKIQLLTRIILETKEKIGGELLNIVYTIMQEHGDWKARHILEHIVSRVAEPFLSMLSDWVFR